jgi:hypothetical protein
MTHEFIIDVARQDGMAILSLRGELDLRYRELLADTAIGLLSEGVSVIADLDEYDNHLCLAEGRRLLKPGGILIATL